MQLRQIWDTVECKSDRSILATLEVGDSLLFPTGGGHSIRNHGRLPLSKTCELLWTIETMVVMVVEEVVVVEGYLLLFMAVIRNRRMQIRLVQSSAIPNPTHQHVASFGSQYCFSSTPNIHAKNAPHITPRFRDCFELVSNRPIQGRV